MLLFEVKSMTTTWRAKLKTCESDDDECEQEDCKKRNIFFFLLRVNDYAAL